MPEGGRCKNPTSKQANSKGGKIHTSGHLRALTKSLLFSSLREPWLEVWNIIGVCLSRRLVVSLYSCCWSWRAIGCATEGKLHGIQPPIDPTILRRHVCAARVLLLRAWPHWSVVSQDQSKIPCSNELLAMRMEGTRNCEEHLSTAGPHQREL